MATYNLMVVSSDPALAEALRNQFTELGYHVEIITQGIAVLPAILASSPNKRPHLIIEDAVIADIGFKELCFQLRRDPVANSIPIALVSTSNPFPESSYSDLGECWDDVILSLPNYQNGLEERVARIITRSIRTRNMQG